MSEDGNYVVFTSVATDLAQSDTNGREDVFLLERTTGLVTLVSHTADSPTTTGDSHSIEPVISADGSYVAFFSAATNLVSGQDDANGRDDVFLYQRATGRLTLVSHTPDSPTTSGNGWSGPVSISADGSYVVFDSIATNLVSGQVDANERPWSPSTGWPVDVFLFERAAGTVALVSRTPASAVTTGNRPSWSSSISGDGAYVVFRSVATDVVSGQNDGNGTFDLFLFARATGTVTLVSHASTSATTASNGDASDASISEDGAFVSFSSYGTDLVSGQIDGNASVDAFLFERVTGAVSLVSHKPDGPTTAANGWSEGGSLSADASFLSFRSSATDLVPGQNDANNRPDIFLFERATRRVTLVSHTPTGASETANDQSHSASISADGGFVVFSSRGTNLVEGQTDTNDMTDVFLFRRATGEIGLVSHAAVSPTTTGNRVSCCEDDLLYGKPSVSVDGHFVAFPSKATDLVSGQVDTNNTEDVFLYQRLADPDAAQADFDGDGDTDVSLFRPSTGVWFVRGGPAVAWGTSGDIPVPGDYDGDGDGDAAVFRPSTGVWFVQGEPAVAWGTSGDIPVPGDYDGDGDTDVAVFRPATGVWFVQGGPTVAWGTSGDIPVPGDYEGDGDTDAAVLRPSTGAWFVNGGDTTAFGTSGDHPLPLPSAIRAFFFP